MDQLPDYINPFTTKSPYREIFNRFGVTEASFSACEAYAMSGIEQMIEKNLASIKKAQIERRFADLFAEATKDALSRYSITLKKLESYEQVTDFLDSELVNDIKK